MHELYICYGYPNDGFIKVGQSVNSKVRTESHFRKTIISYIFQIEADINKVEFDFHKVWKGLSEKHQDISNEPKLCEWYYMFPEEAATFIKLYFIDKDIEFTELTSDEIHKRQLSFAVIDDEDSHKEIEVDSFIKLPKGLEGTRPTYNSRKRKPK